MSDCINVDKGYWNDDIGVSILTKKIMKGTYATTDGMVTPKGTPCPMYHYCPEGSASPIPCDNGFITVADGA